MSVPSDIHVPRGIVPGQPRAAEGEARGVEGIGGFQVALESASVKTIADQESEEKGEDDQKKEEMRRKLNEEPLVCGAFQLKEKESDKYLGEIFHTDGLGRSALETIKARAGKIKAVSYEIKAIIEDYRAEVVGGALCGIELWQMCALPSLLSSSSTWLEITPEAIEIAEQLQLDFLRL